MFFLFRKKKPKVTEHVLAIVDAACALCAEIKQLKSKDPQEAMNLLKGAWGVHMMEYAELTTIAKNVNPTQTIENSVLIALLVLNAYFKQDGDWDKMIEFIKQSYQ